VRVQGTGAAGEIATAIDEFNEYGKVDLLIVGRGGGSVEDLWAFNEEIVARAISRSIIPIISAVGHEIDFTIADFTADLRAATPSAAVEHALPHRKMIDGQIRSLMQRAAANLISRTETLSERLRLIETGHAFRRPREIFTEKIQAVDELDRSLAKEFSHLFEERRNTLHSYEARLKSLNPQSILARGYSISRKLPHRTVLKDSADLRRGDEIEVQFCKGKVHADVKGEKD
jgi:exodeoxyribonuclease VII large subunit